jgi:dihydrofolate reductase
MPFSIIVAMDLKGGIGVNNQLPWNIPQDLEWFKKHTLNNTVIMGSNTYFSLPEKNRPLPNRKNIVLTTNQEKKSIIESEGALVRSSVDEIIKEFSNDNCFIIGGQKVYEQFIDKIEYLYVTKVAGDYNCDAFFNYLPKESDLEWIQYDSSQYIEEGYFVFRFLIFKRIVDYNDLDFMYNFYKKTDESDKLFVSINQFKDSDEYGKTKEKIKLYLRTNKIEKIRKLL